MILPLIIQTNLICLYHYSLARILQNSISIFPKTQTRRKRLSSSVTIIESHIFVLKNFTRSTLFPQSRFSYKLLIHEIFKIRVVKPTFGFLEIFLGFCFFLSQKQFSGTILCKSRLLMCVYVCF